MGIHAGSERTFDILLERISTRLFVLARRICVNWTNTEKNELVALCLQQLTPDMRGIISKGAKVNTNTQAIYTLSVTSDKSIVNRIVPLHAKYKGACLYTHAKTQTELKWIISEFENDAKNAAKNLDSNLQESLHAIAISMANNPNCVTDAATRTKILKTLIGTINSGRLSSHVLIGGIIALGMMCDTRTQKTPFTISLMQEVTNCLNNLSTHYPNSQQATKNRELSLKLIRGEHLSVDEERFLLTKLEI